MGQVSLRERGRENRNCDDIVGHRGSSLAKYQPVLMKEGREKGRGKGERKTEGKEKWM